MAKKTFYGEVKGTSVMGPVTFSSGSKFRLHIGHGHVTMAEAICQTLGCSEPITVSGVIIRLNEQPQPNVVYERELYLSIEKNEDLQWELYLREGPRFMFVVEKMIWYAIVHFLQPGIPELNTQLK